MLIAMLLLAVREDLMRHRIPNVLVATTLASGLLLHSFTDGWSGALFSLSGAVAGLLILLPMHVKRGMGAGDVKLMAAVGACLGPSSAVLAGALTLMLGAVMAMGVMCWRLLGRSRLSTAAESRSIMQLQLKESRRMRFPYAIAIAGGTVLIMWQQNQLDTLLSTLAGA